MSQSFANDSYSPSFNKFLNSQSTLLCKECSSYQNLVPYKISMESTGDLTYGNCEACGVMYTSFGQDTIYGIRTKHHSFRVDVPMDEVLETMIRRQKIAKVYNPTAQYVKKRRVVVDWMCEICEDLKFEAETIHHSIALFDAYFSSP